MILDYPPPPAHGGGWHRDDTLTLIDPRGWPWLVRLAAYLTNTKLPRRTRLVVVTNVLSDRRIEVEL